MDPTALPMSDEAAPSQAASGASGPEVAGQPAPATGATTGAGFAVVDVETTGFSPQRDRVVEVAVVLVDGSGAVETEFATLLDPARDPGPTHVHGITEAMVTGAPTYADVHPYLAHLFSGRVVVGHNIVRFDLPFLAAEAARAGANVPVADLVTIDTLQVARDHLGLYGRATLPDCCDRYGLTWGDHHSALGDCMVTVELLAAVRVEVGDAVLGVAEALGAARRSVWPGAVGAPVAVRRR